MFFFSHLLLALIYDPLVCPRGDPSIRVIDQRGRRKRHRRNERSIRFHDPLAPDLSISSPAFHFCLPSLFSFVSPVLAYATRFVPASFRLPFTKTSRKPKLCIDSRGAAPRAFKILKRSLDVASPSVKIISPLLRLSRSFPPFRC